MKTLNAFYKLSLSTLIAVYLLILVGGIVRSTGSGMGCPDWPKCFGSWVPPTSVSELPDNYKQVYAEYRDNKNKRFARYLRMIGLGSTADQILNDRNVLEEADFNLTKTWIEYLNRVIGVIIGILIFFVFVFSFKFWNSNRTLTVISFLTFVLVGFQGWIGSFVVSTNLTPWTVTVHMFLALVIVAMLVFLVHKSSQHNKVLTSATAFWWIITCIAVVLVQILLGTQVREEIDKIVRMTLREQWISSIGSEFIIHRSFSWIVLLLHIGLILNLHKTQGLKGFKVTLILLILGTFLSGIGMAWFSIPAFLQPVHLLMATGSFGMQFLFLLKVNRKEAPLLTD